MQGLGFRVQGLGIRVEGSGFRVTRGFRVLDSVWGWGCGLRVLSVFFFYSGRLWVLLGLLGFYFSGSRLGFPPLQAYCSSVKLRGGQQKR